MGSDTLVKAIFLDFDGTIIDSSKDLANSINFMLKSLGLKTFEIDLIRSWIGGGATKLVQKALNEAGGEFSDEALQIFLSHYEKNLINQTYLYDGVKDTLLELKKDYILTLITNKPYKFVNPILKHFDLDIFEIVLGGDSLEYKKPHPYPLEYCMDKLNLKPDEVVMVGDSFNDIEAAKNAGVKSILVTYGFDEEIDADYKINNFKDIKKCLK